MDQQKMFMDAIEALKELAIGNGYYLTQKDIEDAFVGMDINKKQKEVIYSYMKSNRITVEGYDGDEGIFEEQEEQQVIDSPDEEEQRFLDMYREEVEGVESLTKEQMYQLYQKAGNDDDAKNKLIEANLKNAIEWVKPFKEKGIPMADLIGEANLSLITAVNDALEENVVSPQELVDFLRDEVIEYVTIYVNDEDETENLANITLEKINMVNDCATRKARELGRSVTVEEVAQELHLNVEEIVNIIKISSNGIANIDYKE